ncbi:hypothetical protein LPJ75_005964, partial [Coemansia sp. RSA 2598]
RARIFGSSEPLAEDIDSAAQAVASRSGVCVEDPQRLLRKQWDETAATALLGAATAWTENGRNDGPIWRIGRASQAWTGLWALTTRFVVGSGGDAVERARMRTRESVRAAANCAAVLADSPLVGECLRIAWDSWMQQGMLLTDVPVAAPADLNQDADGGGPVVRQENLCALLKLGIKIAGVLDDAKGLSHADSSALLVLARRLLLFADVPMAAHSSAGTAGHSATPTGLQGLVLDSVALVERAEPALALHELALLAAAPYAIERHTCASELGAANKHSSALHAVVDCALEAFSSQLARADYLQSSFAPNGRGSPPSLPSLSALGVAAVDRLGMALCSDAGDAPLLQLLLAGAWQDAVAAMGLHMVRSLTAAGSSGGEGGAARGSEWFVRAVPPGMLRLRDDLDRCAEEKAAAMSGALAKSWAVVGAALAEALGMAGDGDFVVPLAGSSGSQQICMLDA